MTVSIAKMLADSRIVTPFRPFDSPSGRSSPNSINTHTNLTITSAVACIRDNTSRAMELRGARDRGLGKEGKSEKAKGKK
jgi:hypothetical protein